MSSTYKNSTADLRLIENLIVSPDTSTVYCKIRWLTWLEIDAANDVLPTISDEKFSVECRHMNFSSDI